MNVMIKYFKFVKIEALIKVNKKNAFDLQEPSEVFLQNTK